jgi:HK97 family phage major capsid protein
MNKKDYLEKRQALLDEAQALLNEGKVEDYKAKEQEIKDLDAKFEKVAKALADMNALAKTPVVTNIEDKGSTVDNAVVGATVDIPVAVKPEDEAKTYRTAFAKNMMGLQLTDDESAVFDRINAGFRNSTQTAAVNTVLVPESVRDGIWKEIGEAHPIIADMAMTFVKGDLTIIKETTSGNDAAWYDEATEITSDDTGFGELNLTGCELSKAITISWKLKKMSVDAFLAYITTKIAEKMGNALAKGVVEGLGKPSGADTFKPQPLGIAVALEKESSTPQIITYNDSTDALTYDKLTDAMAVIKSGYSGGAAIYAKNTVIWGKLAKLKDGDNRPLFIQDVTSGGVGRIFGLVVKEEDGVSDGEILIGNVAKGYVANANENITMYFEDHVKARTTDYMGYAIIDGSVLTTKAFALIKKS